MIGRHGQAEKLQGWGRLLTLGRRAFSRHTRPRRIRTLPLEVLIIIIHILVQTERLGSLTKLALLNSKTFELVVPELWICVKISSTVALEAFVETVMDCMEITEKEQAIVDESTRVRVPRQVPSHRVIRARRYLGSMDHLDISPSALLPNMRLKPPMILGPAVQPLDVDAPKTLFSIRIHQFDLDLTSYWWIRLLFALFKPLHLQWRRNLGLKDDRLPQGKAGERYRIAGWLNGAISKWDTLESWDVDDRMINLPLDKFRYTVQTPHVDYFRLDHRGAFWPYGLYTLYQLKESLEQSAAGDTKARGPI